MVERFRALLTVTVCAAMLHIGTMTSDAVSAAASIRPVIGYIEIVYKE